MSHLWIRVDISRPDDPRIMDLAKAVGMKLMEVWPRVQLLDMWAMTFAPDGDVTHIRKNGELLGRIFKLRNQNKAVLFFDEMLRLGFLTISESAESPDERIEIAEWHEHGGGKLFDTRRKNAEYQARHREKESGVRKADVRPYRTGQDRTKQNRTSAIENPTTVVQEPPASAAEKEQLRAIFNFNFPDQDKDNGTTPRPERAAIYTAIKALNAVLPDGLDKRRELRLQALTVDHGLTVLERIEQLATQRPQLVHVDKLIEELAEVGMRNAEVGMRKSEYGLPNGPNGHPEFSSGSLRLEAK